MTDFAIRAGGWLAAAEVPGGGLTQSLVTLAIALGAAYFAYRQSTRVARIAAESTAATARTVAETEAKRIEADAYQRAQGLVDAQVARQTAEMERNAQQIATQRVEMASQRAEAEGLRRKVLELQDEVARLRHRLIVAGLDDTVGDAHA
jgi:polyhydroxyalkanoate synthesis regulator phasin